MILQGVLANSLAIFAGGLLGMVFRRGIPAKMNTLLMQGLGICVLVIGLQGALKNEDIILTILAVTIGGILGQWLDFDRRLQSFGNLLQQKLTSSASESHFAEGFVNGTLFTCIGAMAIVGSLESGTTGNHEVLYAKALIDGVVIMVMATTMGFGVCWAALSVLFYQSVLTLSASLVAVYFSTPVIAQMSAIGSLLIIGISLNMLEITEIKVVNLLLAPFLPLLFSLFLS